MTEETQLSAEELISQGYRRVSNKHRLVARIDRDDWVQFLAEKLLRAPADFYIPGQRDPAPNWADHYRRVYSRDQLTVRADVFKLIPLS